MTQPSILARKRGFYLNKFIAEGVSTMGWAAIVPDGSVDKYTDRV